MSKQVKLGIVTSTKTAKTIIVATEIHYKHPKYSKIVVKTKNYMAHDEKEECKIGDLVLIEQCAPVSKRKAWTLKEIY